MLMKRDELRPRPPDEEEDGDRSGVRYNCRPGDDGDSGSNPDSGPDDDMGSDGTHDGD